MVRMTDDLMADFEVMTSRENNWTFSSEGWYGMHWTFDFKV